MLLSFNQAAGRVVREQSRYPTGWVRDSFDNEHRDCADALRPDFLFCNKDNIDTALWPGVWKWVVYEVESLDSTLDWLARGVRFVESMWPGSRPPLNIGFGGRAGSRPPLNIGFGGRAGSRPPLNIGFGGRAGDGIIRR